MSNPIFTSLEMALRKGEIQPLPSRPDFRSTIDCLDCLDCLDYIVCIYNEDGRSFVRVYKPHHDKVEDYLFKFSTEEKKINYAVLNMANLVFKNLASIREHPGKQSNEGFILD